MHRNDSSQLGIDQFRFLRIPTVCAHLRCLGLYLIQSLVYSNDISRISIWQIILKLLFDHYKLHMKSTQKQERYKQQQILLFCKISCTGMLNTFVCFEKTWGCKKQVRLDNVLISYIPVFVCGLVYLMIHLRYLWGTRELRLKKIIEETSVHCDHWSSILMIIYRVNSD
jgi:hypothetical protein